jgi:hypothetical protein
VQNEVGKLLAAENAAAALHSGCKLIERDSFVLNELQTHLKKTTSQLPSTSRLRCTHKQTY